MIGGDGLLLLVKSRLMCMNHSCVCFDLSCFPFCIDVNLCFFACEQSFPLLFEFLELREALGGPGLPRDNEAVIAVT
jgi:hypothetical protein